MVNTLLRVNYVLALFCFGATGAVAQNLPAQKDSATLNECVIVLHGMGRTPYSMSKLAKHLQTIGYTVWNEGYPSLSASIEKLAPQAIDPGLDYCRQQNAASVNFVTHSLGGILVRQYLQTDSGNKHSGKFEISDSPNNYSMNLGKIVMLSPPNHGSEVVDKLQSWWLFRVVMGPAALQLSTAGKPDDLKPIPGVIGVITGNESSDPWFSDSIPGPDDGKVSVESAKLDEMADFLVLPVGHTFVMSDPQVLEQVNYFLKNGSFDHSESEPEPLPESQGP